MKDRVIYLFLFLATSALSVRGQAFKDSLAIHVADTLKISADASKGEFGYKQIIIPGVLIGYGIAEFNSKVLSDVNDRVRNNLKDSKHTSIDQFTLYMPAASVYALNAFGIKGKHNFKDRTIIFATAFLLSNGIVKTVKSVSDVKRPNGLVDNSFPSGHTTAAFVGAEFLYQEYKHISIWYGAAGYTVAAATGILRLVNDRHWVSDVIAGAGIGILSTKAAYWLQPYITRLLFSNTEKQTSALFMPFYNGEQAGGMFVMQF